VVVFVFVVVDDDVAAAVVVESGVKLAPCHFYP